MAANNQEITSPTAVPQGDGVVSAQSAKTEASSKMATEAYNSFATPADFLKELNKDYATLPKNTPQYLTKYDLEQIAQNNSDPNMRALAQVADTHYEDLHRLVTTNKPDHDDYLYPKDVAMDLDLETGDLHAYNAAVEKGTIPGALAEFGGASVAAGAAVATMEVPPVAIGFGAIALVLGAKHLEDRHVMNARIAAAPALSNQFKSMTAGWSDVNGGK